jgi:autophagy-related protein 11
MALQIFVSHTGARLYADPTTLPSPDALRSWITEHAGVPSGRQILMTAKGKNVKQQHLLTEGEIFVYDKQFLAADVETVTGSQPIPTLPDVHDPPATIASENSLQAWQELFMARRAWALDVAEIVRNGVDAVQKNVDEAEVIARSTAVALDNLKSHVGTLQNKFQKTQRWANDMLEEHKAALSDWRASVDVLNDLPVRRDIVKILQPSSGGGADGSTSTLHELVDVDRLQKAESDLSEASNSFQNNLQDLEHSVETLLQSTIKVQKYGESSLTNGDASGLLEESETLAKRISTEYEEVLRLPDTAKSVSLASRRALVHTQEFLPTLHAILGETRQALTSVSEDRKGALENCLLALREISAIESGLGELQSQITALNVESQGADGLEAINRIFYMPIAYGSTLVEAIRRSEWCVQLRADGDAMHENISHQRDDEERRRKKWVKTMSDYLQDVTDSAGPAIKVDVTIPDTDWPVAARDEIFAYIDDLTALGIEDAVRQVTQMLRELDTPAKLRKRLPSTFKNGSVHEMEQSFVPANGGNARSLQDEKLRLEDKLRASDSRVRKLEDLLHRSSQMARPASGTFGASPEPERQASSPTSLPPSRPNDQLLSRRSSVSSQRLSNQTEEEKALIKRIVSLEADVMRLQREAHVERRSSTESRDKMQEAESVKRDLMANFEAQRQEFDDERQILEDEAHKLKIRLEEAEDELDRVIGSRDHVRLTSDEKITSLQAEVERLRQGSDTGRQEASRQRERALALEKQVQQLRDERSSMQDNSVELANQLRDAEREQKEHISILQDVHDNLSPSGSAPDQLSKLVTAIEILSEGLSIHARGLEEKLQLVTAETKELEEKVNHAESQSRKLERQAEDHEATSTSLRDALSRETGKLASVRADLADEREELKSLRSKFAAGETGSEALRERLVEEEKKAADFSERLATSDANAKSIQQELDSFKGKLEAMTEAEKKLIARLEARGSRAKDLSQRLFQHNDRMIRMLEQLGYSVTKQDDRLVIQRASKVNASTILAGMPGVESSTMMKRTVSGSPTQHYQDASDLDALYWITDSDVATESAKYQSFTSALARLDLDATIDMITKRYKDMETMAKKYQKESRAYREKSHRLQSEAHDKIAYRSFKEGDLALFLPTRNQATRPWAAFNVGAPHYFLREQDAHKLPNRDWLLARISKVEERVVDLSRSLQSSRAQAGDRQSINTEISDGASMRSVDDENPFELSDGLRWYMIDASEEKPGAPTTPGLGKSTVAASNIEVKGSIRLTKEGKRLKESAAGNTATKTLNKSLDSRRSSSGSKKEQTRSPSITTQTLAPTREGEDVVRPTEADLQSTEAREDAQVFDVVRKDLLLGP